VSTSPHPDVVVQICRNSLPSGGNLPRQWQQDGARVAVHDIPCSGKTDAQYLMHALEGGLRGICVVACPRGECHLTQGNYRAEVRVRMVRRLLAETGIEEGRIELVRSSPDDSPRDVDERIRAAVTRLCAFGVSPVEICS
jgi:coenzyme F420-reducing hydrogenase delta subunit